MKMFANSMNSLFKKGIRTNNKFLNIIYYTNKNTFTEVRKPMMKLNNENYIKHRKITEDLLKVNDITNFTYFAAITQSDMFHEFLFQTLSKQKLYKYLGSGAKQDKDMKTRFKEISSKAGLKPDEFIAKYNQNFNTYLKQFMQEGKDEILEKAKENPEILKGDPYWMEKIKTPEGFAQYLEHFDIDLNGEDWYKFPELNHILLNTNHEDISNGYNEMYLHGRLNEDKLRLEPHIFAMQQYLKDYEPEIESTATLNNEMWVEKLKRDTLSYINTVLDPNFQKWSTSYAKTRDNKRVDVGLIIHRDPIFLDTYPEDMEFGKYRRKFFKKYFFNTDKYIEEVEAFNDVNSDYWDVLSGQIKINVDNKPNIRKWNPEKNDYDFYSSNSKHWTLVDPNVKDNKSIQYSSSNRIYMLFKNKHTEQWELPTMSLYNGDSFSDVKFKLYFCLTGEEFKVYYPNPYPSFHVTRDFHEYEKSDPKNNGLTGVRIYYYDALHFRGLPKVTPNTRHPYVDHVFSPKNEINKYFSQNYWSAVINSLQAK